MGSTTIRKIRNRNCLYYIYYDNKKRKEVYCGLASDPHSKQRLKHAKITDLQNQQEQIKIQLSVLKD